MNIIISILQLVTLRHRKVREFVQSHTAGECLGVYFLDLCAVLPFGSKPTDLNIKMSACTNPQNRDSTACQVRAPVLWPQEGHADFWEWYPVSHGIPAEAASTDPTSFLGHKGLAWMLALREC